MYTHKYPQTVHLEGNYITFPHWGDNQTCLQPSPTVSYSKKHQKAFNDLQVSMCCPVKTRESWPLDLQHKITIYNQGFITNIMTLYTNSRTNHILIPGMCVMIATFCYSKRHSLFMPNIFKHNLK